MIALFLIIMIIPLSVILMIIFTPSQECYICGRRLGKIPHIRYKKNHAVCSDKCSVEYAYSLYKK